MKIRFFDPAKTYLAHKEEFDSEIQRVLSAGDLILRADVEKFEKNLAEFVGTKYAVGLNSGTDALYLALKAVAIQEEDWVAVPSHTFVATAQVVAQIGASPILFDLGEKPSENVQAHMVAHIAGELSELPKTDTPIIEDACQALGAVKNPTTAAQCWSFYPAKILGAFGDAGALTTNSKEIYDYVVEARNHFKTDYSKWGINSRLDNLQAAILNVKFKYLEQTLARRERIAQMYLMGLPADGRYRFPEITFERVWQDYIFRVYDKRDDLHKFLKEQGVETMLNEYPFPIPKGPKSLQYEAETLRLPINEVLTDEEVNYVIEKIKEFYGA
jgi:dTDP-4-amino-4,6-dideoxygalactose transaminase